MTLAPHPNPLPREREPGLATPIVPDSCPSKSRPNADQKDPCFTSLSNSLSIRTFSCSCCLSVSQHS